MRDSLPTVTVIIAARPGQTDVQAVQSACALDYPAEKLEILVTRGRQPSVQRNTAARAARGDLIYFLDDDSMPLAKNLRDVVARFSDSKVAAIGGPSVCPPDAPTLEQAFALAMGAKLAFGPSAARYRSIGHVRPSSEKELILCNLLIRRDLLLELGGFNEKLYPNEENALLDAINKRDRVLLYDPEMVAYRRPRPTLKAFCKMLMTYGRGRAEQFRVFPTPASALNFVPPFFCVFLFLLPFLPKVFLWVLAVYGLLVLAQTLVLPLRRLTWIPGIAGLIFLSHFLYGLGVWHGCFTQLKVPEKAVVTEVAIEKM